MDTQTLLKTLIAVLGIKARIEDNRPIEVYIRDMKAYKRQRRYKAQGWIR